MTEFLCKYPLYSFVKQSVLTVCKGLKISIGRFVFSSVNMYHGSDAVGKPLARLPPHRSLREVFPHRGCLGQARFRVRRSVHLSCYSPQ